MDTKEKSYREGGGTLHDFIPPETAPIDLTRWAESIVEGIFPNGKIFFVLKKNVLGNFCFESFDFQNRKFWGFSRFKTGNFW